MLEYHCVIPQQILKGNFSIMKNIYIVGVGLIGGSFALELKNIFNDYNIIGIDISTQNLKIAKQKNIIDSQAEINDITNAFMIIIAVPVKAIIKILPKILEFIS